ncbi:MAG TPA: ABC transporter ATP-binding protein [Pseudonocardiaceae bacterium]|jgi:ABC-type multidrug transport system fused ATPase/permease subunit
MSWFLRARTVFALCFRAAPGRATALISCQVAANLTTLAGAYSIKLVTDAALHGNRSEAIVAAVVMAGMALLTLLFGRGYLLLTTSVTERAGRHVDSELIRLTGSIPTIEHYERLHYADQLTLIRQERTALAGMLNATVLNLRVGISLIGAVLVLALVNPILLVLPLLGVPALIANQRAAAIAAKAREASAPTSRLRNHLYTVASAPASGKEIRVFGLVDELLARHKQASDELEHRATRAAYRGFARTTSASLVFAVGYAGALLVVLFAAIHGEVTAGTLVLTITLAALLNSQLATAAQYTSYFQRVLSAAGRLIWLREHAQAQHIPHPHTPPTSLTTGIDLEHVSFSYPETDRDTLTNITAHLPAGSVVAIVGENGSGKTTLVKLLSALYRPTSGTIRADDTDLTTIDPTGWQQRISPAFQDFVRFEFTLGESVGVGDLPRVDDEAAITAALTRAGATDLVESGLTSQLGTAWGGTELSGGQWQKLALGRALMREQPLLRIFDEPTASLDAVTEQALFQRIATATRELPESARPTTILVSHRFATATMADQILVLDNGTIIERGDHKSLVNAGGRYAELYELQTQAYR